MARAARKPLSQTQQQRTLPHSCGNAARSTYTVSQVAGEIFFCEQCNKSFTATHPSLNRLSWSERYTVMVERLKSEHVKKTTRKKSLAVTANESMFDDAPLQEHDSEMFD